MGKYGKNLSGHYLNFNWYKVSEFRLDRFHLQEYSEWRLQRFHCKEHNVYFCMFVTFEIMTKIIITFCIYFMPLFCRKSTFKSVWKFTDLLLDFLKDLSYSQLRSIELGWVEHYGSLKLIWKSRQFSLYFQVIKKNFRSNTDTLNSWTQYIVQSIIKSPILPCQTGTSQFNWQLYVKLRLNVLTARFGKCLITDS